MKLFHYEEERRRVSKGGNADDVMAELTEVKVLLDEKARELVDRNLLLSKARGAIENLQTDLALAKAELAESRRGQLDPTVLHEREAELVEARARIRELESRDRSRVEDVLRLNNQLRDAQDRIAGDKLERRGWDEARARLERDLAAASSEAARLQAELERRARAGAETAEAAAEARGELEAARSKLVESARQLGEQRSREAEQVSRLQDAVRREELRCAQLQQQLRSSEAERDAGLRHLAVVERAAEELQERLREAEARAQSSEAAAKDLELQLVRSRDATAAAEIKLQAAGERRLDELRLASANSESELRQQLAELRGKVTALEFARDEALGRGDRAKAKLERLSAELGEARKAAGEAAGRAAAERAAADQAAAAAAAALAEQTRRREAAEEEAQRQVQRAKSRETDLRRHVANWEENLVKSLDGLLPQAAVIKAGLARGPGAMDWTASDAPSTPAQAQLSPTPGPLAAPQRPHPQADSGRAAPRTLADGEHVISMKGGALAMKDGSLEGLPMIGTRIERLRHVTEWFNNASRDLERGWQERIRAQVALLERAEARLRRAEDRVTMLAQSQEAVARVNSSAAGRSHRQLEQRLEEAREALHEEGRRRDRLQGEKDRMHEALTSSKEQTARLEGELRQARAELEAAREEKRRSEHKLEQLLAAQAVLEENSRMLSLELQDRAKQVADLGKALQRAKGEADRLRLTLGERDRKLADLERELDHTERAARAKDRQLKDTRSKLDRSLHSVGAVPDSPIRKPYDDLERSVLHSLEESERVIHSSKHLHQQHPGLLPAQLASLERAEAMLRELLAAATDLVERTQALLSARSRSAIAKDDALEVGELLRANRRVALDLQGLGDDFHALHRRLLLSLSDSRVDPRSPPASAEVAKDSTASLTAPRRAPDVAPERAAAARRTAAPPGSAHSIESSPGVRHDMLSRLSDIRLSLEECAAQMNWTSIEDNVVPPMHPRSSRASKYHA
jgi:chromosome segregation ATPase